MQDYFSLLGFPRLFEIDEKAVHEAYLAAQRAAHPDRQAGGAGRIVSLQSSANLNDAYRFLRDPMKRAEHLLALEGVRIGHFGDEVKASSVLLMESMDMRERLMEATDSATIDALDAEARTARTEARQVFARHYDEKRYMDAAQAVIRWRFLQKFIGEVNAVRKARFGAA